uniref:Uncharacterized protein n=1 Tax=Opuntia streptacantha TaxID=393608 RepID=A0A7C9AV88_OPUST
MSEDSIDPFSWALWKEKNPCESILLSFCCRTKPWQRPFPCCLPSSFSMELRTTLSHQMPVKILQKPSIELVLMQKWSCMKEKLILICSSRIHYEAGRMSCLSTWWQSYMQVTQPP